jgi:hypothetical protein
VIEKVPTEAGVPVMLPVAVARLAHAGSPEACQEVAGRLVESVREKVFAKGWPKMPAAVWLAVMIGAPSEIVKATIVAVPIPPLPVAVKLALNEPFAAGVPVIAPVVVLSESPAGSPVADQEDAGRFEASLNAGVVAEKASPTLPEKLCAAVIIGGPTAIEIVTVLLSDPPGPVAVSVIVVLPLSCGVPVIAPVVELIVAQPGSPAAAQIVTGRLRLSVSENVLLKAVPTFPKAVCPAVMLGGRETTSTKGHSKEPGVRVKDDLVFVQKLNCVAGLANLEARSGRITFGKLD